MKKMKKLLLLFILICSSLYSQDKFTISGYVKDAGDGEAIIGAIVYKQGTQISTITNEYGFYSLTLPAGSHTIVTSYLGYTNIISEIELNKNTILNLEPKELGRDLQEVEVSAEAADKNIKNTEMGATKIDIKQIQKMPALLGEVDVIKAIQLLPGVTTVGEGASGFNVRGGNIDQNLVLLDEAPVYNSSHLFGFFSVFNPDAVKDVKLIKGGIPSQYGGRVSSILDIRMKEGNNKTYEVNGGIGTIFSRLAIEAPIKKDKASFIIAGRRSYIDVLAKPELKRKSPELANAKFYFYDLTAKLNWKINNKNTVFTSGYFGKDVFGAGFTFNWGNATTTIRWNRVINNKLFMNITGFYSNYDYELGFKQDGTSQQFNWKSNIINYSIKPDFIYYANSRSTIRFGLQGLLYNFKPGIASVTDDKNNTTNIGLSDKRGIEYSAYVGQEYKLRPRLILEYGLRWSAFSYIAKTIYNYRDTITNMEKPLASEQKFEKWQF